MTPKVTRNGEPKTSVKGEILAKVLKCGICESTELDKETINKAFEKYKMLLCKKCFKNHESIEFGGKKI